MARFSRLILAKIKMQQMGDESTLLSRNGCRPRVNSAIVSSELGGERYLESVQVFRKGDLAV